MFERFTDRARRVVVDAQDQARAIRNNYIGSEHLLLALLMSDGLGGQLLAEAGITAERLTAEVEERSVRSEKAITGHIPFTPAAKKVLELSLREALQMGHNFIDDFHILAGILRSGIDKGYAKNLGAEILAELLTESESTPEAFIAAIRLKGKEVHPPDERVKTRPSGSGKGAQAELTLGKATEEIGVRTLIEATDAIQRWVDGDDSPPDDAVRALLKALLGIAPQ